MLKVLTLLLLSLAAIAPAGARETEPGREVEDLHYGDVLFHFFQENYFDSLTRLMAAREMGRAEEHALDGELLRGGMLLSYGVHREAADVFRSVIESETRLPLRNQAWFYLGRVSFERGAWEQAEEAFGRIEGELPPRMDAEWQMLEAQLLLRRGRIDEATARLAAWKAPDDWVGFARFNLGVAMIEAGRLETGTFYLDTVGTQLALEEEQFALRDRANVALGYAFLREDRAAEAREVLRRVRLEGPYSNRALLGVGWAESALGNFREALVPWTELAGRDLLDPAVQEALLALPYAIAELGANSEAIDRYERAIVSFSEQSQRLDGTIEAIRGGEMVARLLENDPRDEMSWRWRLAALPDSVESRYLDALMASNRFQEGLRNYRDLLFLRDNLSRWSEDVAVFSDMIDTRKLAYTQRLPTIEQTLAAVDVPALGTREASLNERFAAVQATGDVVGLANQTELDQWRKLESIGQRLDALGEGPQTALPALSQRILSGVLYWKLNSDYRARLRTQSQELEALKQALDDARRLRMAVDEARQQTPLRFKAFETRIAAQTRSIGSLIERVDQTLARQEVHLQQLAIAELEDYQRRLDSYTLESRYALSRLYDRAASGVSLPDAAPDAKPPATESVP